MPTTIQEESTQENSTTAKKSSGLRTFLLILFLIVIGSFTLYIKTTPSSAFLTDTIVNIKEGSSLSSIAHELKSQHIIRSVTLFSMLISESGKEKTIEHGVYLFHSPENVFQIAKRFETGDHGIKTKKITLPEGLNRREMATILEKNLPQFESTVFIEESKGQEGYLFPDTYFFYTTATTGEVRAALSENFIKKTEPQKISTLGENKDWAKIIIMASLIEGEAVTPDDRRIVSGILWTRLQNNMRLGVDAPFVYIIGKGSLELTLTDLATTSPYNTYRNTGLPPTPINNPGVDTIEAALHPSSTPYLYYLSDKQGVMHYAKSFAEHKLNKEKYLR